MIRLARTVIVAIFHHMQKRKPFLKRQVAQEATHIVWIETKMVSLVNRTDSRWVMLMTPSDANRCRAMYHVIFRSLQTYASNIVVKKRGLP